MVSQRTFFLAGLLSLTVGLVCDPGASETQVNEPAPAETKETAYPQTEDTGSAESKTETCAPTNESAYTAPEDRGALALKDDWYGDSAEWIVYLPQNWSPSDSMWFYYTSQGSELVPYNYFVNLEQEQDTALFIEPKNMVRFRALPQQATPENPDGLPVGFVRNGNALGFTCAACHTNQINYKGTGIRVDGAPTLSDLAGLIAGLEKALWANLDDAKKFDRFAKRILGRRDTPDTRAELQTHLWQTLNTLSTYMQRNASDVQEGFSRLDAMGRIYNAVIENVAGQEHYREPNAPASYPFLWDTPQHDWVLWMGLTPNANVGSLGRNAGEVIGVFAKLNVVKHTTRIGKLLKGYQSTVRVPALVEMEELIRRLQAPQWPDDILPAIDTAKAEQGKALYETHCIQCHKLIDPADPKRSIRAQMYDINLVGTDKTEAMNAVTALAPTGILEGTPMPEGHTYGPQAPVVVMLDDLVKGVLARNKIAALQAAMNAEKNGNSLKEQEKEGEYQHNSPENPFASVLAYKARPLDGIWATAPYLHNGSVPTLYDLLLPEAERPQQFAVGQREFDPVKVGFKHDPADPQAPFVIDTSVPGNANTGHNYGAVTMDGKEALTEEQRWELVEYMKTL